jgi:hypothetical protein
MKSLLLPITVLSILFLSCERNTGKKPEENISREYYADGKIKSETQVSDTIAHGLRKQYDRDGGLMSVYTFNMGKLDGPAVSYYPNKKLNQKMFYKDGKREGTTLWYYDTGELYRSIPYKDGKINGTRISYYKDGKIMSEAPFKEDLPGLGLKEYSMKGNLLTDDTKIIIEVENRLFAENVYIIKLRLSNPENGICYYLGELVDGKYIGPYQWQLPGNEGVASFTINLSKGGFRMETLIFTASYKTAKSNYQVISRSYNLAIDNK